MASSGPGYNENKPLVGIISLAHFIQSTRDSGYTNLVAAVAELVDNAIEAHSKRVEVTLRPVSASSLELEVVDDGLGMDGEALMEALQFGGSSRYNGRTGLGRYGMGLPNASLSHARRLEITSCRMDGEPMQTYLDLDEIMAGEQLVVPRARRGKAWSGLRAGGSGTLVRWLHCDRLRTHGLGRRLDQLRLGLGRVFRYFIWDGLNLSVNGVRVEGYDPLSLDPRSRSCGATLFGEELTYEVSLPTHLGGSLEGLIRVKFAELPVHSWGHLNVAQKRALGIPRGAGVSIVRAGREIDHGWFFMGSKRREAYDDWWRAEVAFEPPLDEAFGITHTKQHVAPTGPLLELLTQDMEQLARVLNARARTAHKVLKSRARLSGSEKRAQRVEERLPALPPADTEADFALLQELLSRHPEFRTQPPGVGDEIRLVEAELGARPIYEFIRTRGRLIVVFNMEHPLYKKVYAPLVSASGIDSARRRSPFELWLLALARSEAAVGSGDELVRYRKVWSRCLTELLKEDV